MSSASAPPRVLIIGLGIAGPILALLLQRRGYSPIILEKVSKLGDAGASLMLFPNGLKVASLLGLDATITSLSPHLELSQDLKSDGSSIGGTELPTRWKEQWGQPACGVKRTELNLLLKDAVVEKGIVVKEGWKLVDIRNNEDGTVTAVSATGEIETGDFLVGCDGIHSAARGLVLKSHGIDAQQDPEFTSLIQTAGMSPTPPSLQRNPGMRNYYGPNAHIIAYPVSSTTTSWAISSRSATAEVETWKQLSPSELSAWKSKLLQDFSRWDPVIGEMITAAQRIIRYGLYDRPLLPAKYWLDASARCVLIGDAAHPTSPHLGQGGNQALEDAYHLSQLLPDLSNPSHPSLLQGSKLDESVLREAFEKFANMREERTGKLVKGARAVGERRVASEAECESRDEGLRRGWEDKKSIEEKWTGLLSEPFLV